MTLSKPTQTKLLVRTIALGILLLFVLFASQPVHAQTYLFSVPQVQMQVYVQRDASVRIEYEMRFQNSVAASPIDIIDIGTPTSDYDISNMQASIDGVRLTDIRRSEFVKPGVEIHLGSRAIRSGQQGTFQFIFTIPDMVFQDVTNNELATMQITPTWFGSEFVQGSTNLQIAIHLPEGVPADTSQVLSQEVEYNQLAIFQAHTVAYWSFPNTRFTGAHLIGISFPSQVMNRVVQMSLWQLTTLWFESHPNLRLAMGVIAVSLFSLAFFRFSGNTGWSVWLVATGVSIWLFINNAGIQLLCFLPIVIFFIINEYRIRERKKTYLPAIAHVEGGGIKRGLTAPEAAALLEMPLNKVLILVLFGMLQKGLIKQTKAEPLTVEVAEQFSRASLPADSTDNIDTFRRKKAQELGIVLHKYENSFLNVIDRNKDKPVHRISFAAPMKTLLEWVVKRVQGFNLTETREYYQRIVARAVTEAKSMGDIPQFELAVDRNLGWLMMADEYATVFNRPQWGGYHYHPSWVRPMGGSGGLPSTSKSSTPNISAPSLGDVAAGFAGWTENTMGNLASSVLPANVTGGTGAVNLGGFDTATSNFFEALAKNSGGSSSGGGGCACAGCACACACAGGGR